jgi:hypothetical protein
METVPVSAEVLGGYTRGATIGSELDNPRRLPATQVFVAPARP